jgi:hypothetical protein
MSDTGATPEQIEAAVCRRWPTWLTDARADTAHSVDLARARFTHSAHFLVPPGYAIVDPEQIASIRFAEAVLDQMIDDAMFGESYPIEQLHGILRDHPHSEGYQGHHDRLVALIGDKT